MKKIRKNNFLIVLLLSFICGCKSYQRSYTFSIREKSDTSVISFCKISIIDYKKYTRDTLADIDGNFFYKDKKSPIGFIFRAESLYPKFISNSELKRNNLVFLEKSITMEKTGGMGVDTLLLEINDSLKRKFYR